MENLRNRLMYGYASWILKAASDNFFNLDITGKRGVRVEATFNPQS